MSKNKFSPLIDMDVVCFNCINFCHIDRDYRTNFRRKNNKSEKKKTISSKVEKKIGVIMKEDEKVENKPKKVWKEKKKIPTESMIAKTSLHAK